ncbi:MAG: NADH-quinone oxidoreductase subunit NuoG [Rickettsiales bacterium]|jgi:NADH-quinone oxidoreductase subunit G|nr:NADH-quinone oxidoreductase subunit NuoG [Rickettsiales bacterium]
MPKLTIDGKEITVEEGTTVIQACEELGIEIPRFCYHPRLAIAGNCRMCLVEVERAPKPIASCAQPAMDNMVVHTNTPKVKKAREGVMEFLLANHPLDCPICDQAGECDLQDQSMAYGKGQSRYKEEKRAVVDKDFGPLIKTYMTRCIHCTRCVRFITDVAGIPEIGALYRGEDTEITTYIEKSISSELSGNIIDLCPVGALTSKPYAFKARSWELSKTESIDVLDAVGSNIRVDSRGREVMRILPRLNESVNEEWISDKTRFAYDGLKKQRLDTPYVKHKGKLKKATWDEAYKTIADRIKSLKENEIGAIAGDLIDVEAMLALKELWAALGSDNLDCRQYNEKINSSNRGDYIFNTSIAGIEDADFCLIVGSNPRKEAAILNARIRKSEAKIALLGTKADLTYEYEYLGEELNTLEDILKGKHPIAKQVKEAKKPMLILGSQVISLDDGTEIITLCKLIAEKYNFIQEDWNGFNILQRAAARVGALDIGFVPGDKGYNVEQILEKTKLVYLLGADEVDITKLKDKFVIYQGSHGDKGAHAADVILPGCAYTEKDSTYVNLEGRVQRAHKASSPPGEAKEDWKIICELSSVIGKILSYSSLWDIRDKLCEIAPHFANIGQIKKEEFVINSRKYHCDTKVIRYNDSNYYLTDPICRASVTMSKCAKLAEEI